MKFLIKILSLFLLTGVMNCQQDEVTIYRFRKDATIESTVDFPKALEVSHRQCNPRCGKNEYCNSTTGKCEGLTEAPVIKPEIKEDKSAPKEEKSKPAVKERLVGDVFMVNKIGNYDPRYDTIPIY